MTLAALSWATLSTSFPAPTAAAVGVASTVLDCFSAVASAPSAPFASTARETTAAAAIPTPATAAAAPVVEALAMALGVVLFFGVAASVLEVLFLNRFMNADPVVFEEASGLTAFAAVSTALTDESTTGVAPRCTVALASLTASFRVSEALTEGVAESALPKATAGTPAPALAAATASVGIPVDRALGLLVDAVFSFDTELEETTPGSWLADVATFSRAFDKSAASTGAFLDSFEAVVSVWRDVMPSRDATATPLMCFIEESVIASPTATMFVLSPVEAMLFTRVVTVLLVFPSDSWLNFALFNTAILWTLVVSLPLWITTSFSADFLDDDCAGVSFLSVPKVLPIFRHLPRLSCTS